MFLNVQVTFMMAEGVNDVERFFVRPDDLRLAIGHPNISGMDIRWCLVRSRSTWRCTLRWPHSRRRASACHRMTKSSRPPWQMKAGRRGQNYPGWPVLPTTFLHAHANPLTRRAGGRYRGKTLPSSPGPDSCPFPSVPPQAPAFVCQKGHLYWSDV